MDNGGGIVPIDLVFDLSPHLVDAKSSAASEEVLGRSCGVSLENIVTRDRKRDLFRVPYQNSVRPGS